ncbi:MAG TPA: cytidylate kinase-like family protein [Dehalococcoidales bacterium]|jgi:cytidylate kinase|nr:cytidylate kinase-like family protein [Dehalococcoidales bacterium]
MTDAIPHVITISRQLGSGGAYLGQRLAFRLNALYLDHEIVRQAAEELNIPEENLAVRDEKVTSRWQAILQSFVDTTSLSYDPPPLDTLNDKNLYKVESDIITRIANQRSAVIVGRGGHYVLRQHPGCLSVFLHADIDFRQKRVQELYNVSPKEALKLINSIDQDRGYYLKALTGQDWLDARQYHLSLDTGVLGLDKAEDIILKTLQARFGDVNLEARK